MARKEYESPNMKVSVLDCKDAVTTSEPYYDSNERTVVGSFSRDWGQYFDTK